MTKYDVVKLSAEIKNGCGVHDFSSYLYSAVGLIKQQNDTGTAYAVLQLVTAIEESSNGNLSDFCKRKIEIIKNESAKILGDFFEKFLVTQESLIGNI